MQEFVPIEAVDPVYFDRTYYLGPGKGGEAAYQLLRRAIVQRGRGAIAKYTMRGKTHVMLLRPVGDGVQDCGWEPRSRTATAPPEILNEHRPSPLAFRQHRRRVGRSGGASR